MPRLALDRVCGRESSPNELLEEGKTRKRKSATRRERVWATQSAISLSVSLPSLPQPRFSLIRSSRGDLDRYFKMPPPARLYDREREAPRATVVSWPAKRDLRAARDQLRQLLPLCTSAADRASVFCPQHLRLNDPDASRNPYIVRRHQMSI